MSALALFCFLTIVSVVRSDLYGCSQETSCKTCIKHNPCGWCETNIMYEDGTMGPQCAGKPQDPKNPPKDYKPWTCPSSFQNLFCPAYYCSNKTYQCVSTMNADGKPFDQCFANCLAPVYSCNKTDAKCYLSVPGIGTDKVSCEKGCVDALYTCDKKVFQCIAVKTGGKPFQACQQECFPPTYDCDETNKTCYVVKPGQGTDLNSCKATCGKSLAPSKTSPTAPTQQSFYQCNETDFTCTKVKHGQSLSACQAVCGNPSNVTPSNLIGDYRGLQVNKNYVKGEWTMQITQAITVIKDPTGKVWAQGNVATYGSELWLVTSKGKYRGIDSQNTLPEVFTLTWALGALNGNVPQTFDEAVKSGIVFTMKKCLNPGNCKWLLSAEAEREDVVFHARAVSHKHHKRAKGVNDPCSAYSDCQTCINANDYCGWCSVNVLYNATIPGTQCAGLNQTKVPGFLCRGAFSTVDCPTIEPPSVPPTTVPPTSIPPLRPTAPVMPPPPTAPVVLYICNPATSTCEKNSTGSGGIPLEQCNLTCNVIPDVPVVLRGRKFRGLQIQSGYMVGEFTVTFNTTSAIFVNPKGVTVPFIVSQTGQYMVLNLPNGQKIFTLWQIGEDAVVDFLSWSWGATGGPAPSSFDTSMLTTGQSSFVFDGCSQLSSVCDFGQ